MIRAFSISVIFCLLALPVSAQDDDFLKNQLAFLNTIKGSFEGYHSSDCKSIISYHSLRNDVTDGLLTRATNGAMGVDWELSLIHI